MKLIEQLPEFYVNSPEVLKIQDTLEIELIELFKANDFLFLQLDLLTATGWGLELWEQAYGLHTDVTKSDEFRRTRVLAKMRGVGTTTVALIKNISESFSNGEVEVTEVPREYKFLVKFVGTKGMPPNIEDLKSAIYEAKPAHLGLEFIFVYNTYKELGKYTHKQMGKFTHMQLTVRE